MCPHTQRQPTPLPLQGTVFFIADVHLSPEMPKTTQALLAFLRTTAPQADALCILGDFFEYWIGDDVLQTDTVQANLARTIFAALHTLTQEGTRVWWMAGNRDFLLGQAALRRIGVQILPDPTVIQLGRHTIALCHGDALCTDDHAYQRMRRWFRCPWVQKLFLWLPLTWRLRVAQKLRATSTGTAMSQSTLPSWMDTTPKAVKALFQASAARTIIHGHTHRPARHETPEGTRWVLSDWDLDGKHPRASYLRWADHAQVPTVHAL